jgi:hypothetical protein
MPAPASLPAPTPQQELAETEAKFGTLLAALAARQQKLQKALG